MGIIVHPKKARKEINKILKDVFNDFSITNIEKDEGMLTLKIKVLTVKSDEYIDQLINRITDKIYNKLKIIPMIHYEREDKRHIILNIVFEYRD